MHILIVPSWYPIKTNSIRGVFFKEQCLALQKNGFKVTVAFPEIWSVKKIGKNEGVKGLQINNEQGLKTYRYKGYNYLPKVPHFPGLIYYSYLKKIYNILLKKEGKPDIIHAHSVLWGGWAAAKLSEETGTPLVITEHSSAFDRKIIKSYQETYIKKALDISNQVIVVGPSLEKHLKKYVNKSKIKMIPNIVDVENFNIGLAKPSNQKFRLLSIAFLTYNKGMDILIKSFSEVFKNINDIELIIGGDGKELNNLIQLTKELGISNKVQFLGRLTREQVREEMQKCNVFVLASRFETFGVVYIEALACGKPIIATKCGGPEMIVNRDNGIIVEKDNIIDLRNALEYIYDNYKNYNPILIREHCEQLYGEKAIVDKLEKVYKELDAKSSN